MDKIDYKQVTHLFKQKRKILVTSHSNPDGDAVGSSLALFHFFTQQNFEIDVIFPDIFPQFLNWLPMSDKALIFNLDPQKASQLFKGADIIFCLDYNAPTRIGEASDKLTSAKGTKILIDHHIDPEKDKFDYCFSTIDVSSTSELVYQFMQEMDSSLINKEIAECIYTGIVTDTGSFSYNCNFPSTFETVADLIKKGINIPVLSRLIYSTNRKERIRLLGYALSEKLEVLPEYRTAFISLTKKELNVFEHKTGDTEGLVNYALSIKGIIFAALFTERENKIRISFRSVGNFSVNNFARKHFEGGGHKNAAGGDSFTDMDQTINKFKRLLSEYADQLK